MRTKLMTARGPTRKFAQAFGSFNYGSVPGLIYDFDPNLPGALHVGGAVQLTSASSQEYKVSSPDSSFDLGIGDFSVAIAFKRDSGGGSEIFASCYEDANNYWRIGLSASSLLFFESKIGGVTKINVASTTAVVDTAGWHTGIIVVDRDSAGATEAYLDGSLDTSGTPTVSTDSLNLTDPVFYIGQAGDGTLYWNGKLARLQIFKGTLFTSDNVTWWHNSGLGRFHGELDLPNTNGSGLTPDVSYDLDIDTDALAIAAAGVNANPVNTPTSTTGPDGNDNSVDDTDPVISLTTRDATVFHFGQDASAKRGTSGVGANGVNGRTVITLDGSDDLYLRAAKVLSGTEGVFFSVSEIVTGAANRNFLSQADNTGAANKYWVGRFTTDEKVNLAVNDGGGEKSSTGDTEISAGMHILMIRKASGGAVTLSVDGSDETEVESGGTPGWWDTPSLAIPVSAIGGLFYNGNTEIQHHSGKIARQLAYSTNPTDSQVNRILKQLSQDYGIDLVA